jgi:energy-coupling factor transport system ATP-binding protein
MGANGAGKTTLCLSLNGVIPTVINGEYSGKVTVDGLVTTQHMVYEMAQKIGVTLQNPETQIFSPTVKSEIVFGCENLGIPRDEILERLDFALKVTRIELKENQSPAGLSGGQKQRLALAAAIALQPKVMVLDEPTSQLDPIGTEDVFKTIRDLNKKYQITVIVAEHKSEEIAEYADKILVLDEGEKLFYGTPREVFEEEETLRKIFVKIPRVSQLAHFLKRGKNIEPDRLPVTLDQGVEYLSALLDLGKFNIDTSKLKPPKMKMPTHIPVIETKDLWHIYPGGTRALRCIDLRIYQGDFVASIGQNGSGKTTLVKHFVGALKPTRGAVMLKGEETSKFTIGELARKVGLVLQNPDFMLFADSIKNEVAFGPRNLGFTPEEVDEKVKESLEVVGLDVELDLFPLRLSQGDRRKLSVAAIHAMEPEILILDEPTTGQDFKGRYDIVEIAERLNKKGHTIIMITHDMELVAKYAQRTIVMGVGKILLDGPTPEVFGRSDILKDTFIQPPQITQLFQKMSKYNFPRWVRSTTESYEILTGEEVP